MLTVGRFRVCSWRIVMNELRQFRIVKALLALGLLILAPASLAAQQRVLPDGVNAGLAFENGGHDTVGPYKWRGFILLQDQLKLGESIKFDGTLSGEVTELQGISVSYDQPLWQNWKLHMNGSFNHTHPGGVISEFFDQDVNELGGGGNALGTTLSYTYQPSDKLVMIFSGGFQSLDVSTQQTSKVFGFSDSTTTQRTRDLQAAVSLNYNFSKDTGVFGAVGFEQGVDVLDPEGTRQNFDPTASILRFNGSFKHNMAHRTQLAIRGGGQWTQDRVNRLKLFSLGGWDYASGYKTGERSGDKGAGARIELNQLNVTNLPWGGQLYYQPFVFIDGGITYVNDPIGSETSGWEKKASAGFGISFEATNGLHAGLQLSFPISGPTVFDGQDTDPRFLFNVGIKQ